MTEDIGVADIFKKLSDSSRKLLIAMTHLSERGAKRDAILAASALDGVELDKGIEELKQFNLIQSGKLLTDGIEQSFVVGEGDRFRQAPLVQEAVYKDILKIEPIKSEFKKR